MNLARLKRQYERLRAKYRLPSFQQLNEEFEIERAQERETEFLLRELRHAISDKISAFLRFFEFFLNPAVAPVFVLIGIKNLTAQDRELIDLLYKKLVMYELQSIKLDLIYSEKAEAEFIKRAFKSWQALRPELKKFFELLSRLWPEEEKEKRTYVG